METFSNDFICIQTKSVKYTKNYKNK